MKVITGKWLLPAGSGNGKKGAMAFSFLDYIPFWQLFKGLED